MEPREQEMMRSVRGALDAPGPLPLLDLVSAMLTAVDPRARDPFDAERDEHATQEELAESFLGTPKQETSVMLAVIAATTEDELLARRIRRELISRTHKLPAWLRNLSFDITHVEEMTDALGDGDDIIIGVRLPSGYEFSLLVYIDHNVGTLVKDAFSVDQPVATLLDTMKSQLAQPDQAFQPLDPADARTRIEDAIATAAITYPPFESDTWPACRPLVEWVVRTLPTGGQGYGRPEWSDADVRALSDDFFASEYGRPHDTHDKRDLFDSILWFGTDYGPGDPLRWSPVAVEILLTDWVPRKIVADAEHLSAAPDVLRAFIRYAHARRGIRAERTAETLEAVDRWEPGYQETIRTPRRQGPEALLERLGVLGERDDWAAHDGDDDRDIATIMLDSLRRAVGGDDALQQLETDPLPDEDFAWERVPEDVHQRVTDVLVLCDAFADARLGVEFRTACRRFLADVAAGDPVVFRRKGAAHRAAAAVCWVIAKANNAVGTWSTMEVQELLAFFNVQGSASQRAEVMLRAIGVNPHDQFGRMDLGTPRYLTSQRRAEIVEHRDRYRSGDFLARPELQQPGVMSDDEDFWGDDEDDEFLQEWREVDQQAAQMLRETCADTLAAEPPQHGLATASERLRDGMASHRWPFDYFADACGWRSGEIPADDRSLWIDAAAATISPPEDPGSSAEELASVAALMHADWFGLVVGLVRRGAGARFDGDSVTRDIANCPELDDESDDPGGDAAVYDSAAAFLVPLWQGLGILDEAELLTALGAWGLPHALHQVWADS
jgi:hypothetical protein